MAETKTHWRLRYDAHGSRGYTTAALMNKQLVRDRLQALEELRATNIHVIEVTISETERELTPAEFLGGDA